MFDLIKKTELIADDSKEDRAKCIQGTRVEDVLKNSEGFEKTLLVPKGDSEKSLTRNEIINKLKDYAQEYADRKHC